MILFFSRPYQRRGLICICRSFVAFLRRLCAAFARFPLLFAVPQLIDDAHHEQRPLQAPRDDVYPPRAPTLWPQSCGQAGGPDEAARRLDAHHRDAQACHPLQRIGRPDLREVLDECQDGGDDAEKVGPSLQQVGSRRDEDDGDQGRGEGVDDAYPGHDHRRLVCRLRLFIHIFDRRRIQASGSGAREVDEEEEESVRALALVGGAAL